MAYDYVNPVYGTDRPPTGWVWVRVNANNSVRRPYNPEWGNAQNHYAQAGEDVMVQAADVAGMGSAVTALPIF